MIESITSDDILGKIALDPRGEVLGTLTKLHIDNDKKILQGITIDQGFARPDLYIGIEHVKFFGDDAVLLNTIPFNRFNHLEVLSAEGKLLGRVREVIHNNIILQGIVVEKKSGLRGKKSEVTIGSADIKELGETIILRKNDINWNKE